MPTVTAQKSPAAPLAKLVETKGGVVASAADSRKTVEQGTLSEAWMLQLGAFKDKANAQKTLSLLQSKGFRATLNSRTPGVVKVQVGPEVRRDRAEALRQRVLTSTGMAGVLVRFQP
jgi:DedD protein